MMFGRFIFDVVSIFVSGAIIGAVIAWSWLAKQDRLDSPGDMKARDRMLSETERSFYEHAALARSQNDPDSQGDG